jgi:hypothetical protein
VQIQDKSELASVPLVAAVYSCVDLEQEYRQSEIITGVTQHVPIFTNSSVELEEIVHSYAIILSQDCDLLRDFDDYAGGRRGTLNSVLLYELRPFDEMKLDLPKGRDIRKSIEQNNHERYHFLESMPPNNDLQTLGLPPLLIDFRRYFTIVHLELRRQCGLVGGALRRSALVAPYREHLQTRAAAYFQRVTLPAPHLTPD